MRDECLAFWRGRQHVDRNTDNYLVSSGTVQGSKPPYRSRRVRNILVDVVRHEVSAATSRVPSYQIRPSTLDPEDVSAAQLGQKVALYGYDKWFVRRAIVDVVTLATVVPGGGFIWPFFDSTIPPYIAEGVGIGDIRLRTYSANEVFWEPGVRFHESRYHGIEQARPIEEVEELPGFLGGKLSADGESRGALNGGKKTGGNLVLVTEFLERPCPKYPDGRWLTIANGRVIVGFNDDGSTRPYPLRSASGEPVDEPVLHNLSYISDPDSDRDQGLVQHLLDPQRTINDCINKQTEWKNLALNPQLILRNLTMKQRLTDEPGRVYRAFGNGDAIWRPVPPIPPELEAMRQAAIGDIGRIASQNDIPSQVEAARAIQAIIERDENARQSFIANLADFHSRLMRHLLYLVAQHYTEPRLVKIRGRFGFEQIPDFRGSDLRSQVDVTVLPESLVPRTRQQMEQRIQFYAQNGWIDPHKAISAIESGEAEVLLDDVSADISWQNYEIQQMVGLARGEGDVPIARQFDNHSIHLDVLHQWMKTPDFANAPPPVQEAAMLHEQQHQQLQAQQQAQVAAQQTMMAEQLGLSNAAKPQGPKQLPDQPSQPSGQ